jgi:hypothetical protein
METIEEYTVEADRTTGEWRGEPVFVELVKKTEWEKMTDTPGVHYDTYEHDGVTRAIRIVSVD